MNHNTSKRICFAIYSLFLIFLTYACSQLTLSHGSILALSEKKMSVGNPIFIRIFKQEQILELWIMNNHGDYDLYKEYTICTWSGEIGAKEYEGDKQSPEGFYHVSRDLMNPNSEYHLSFNIGFPNNYDTLFDRTGSYLMVHGGCSSAGCYAMTDPYIEEIYLIADAAFKKGQDFFNVHIFPFRMTDQKMLNHVNNKWFDFWVNLKKGYDHFNIHKTIPMVIVNTHKKEYAFYKQNTVPEMQRILKKLDNENYIFTTRISEYYDKKNFLHKIKHQKPVLKTHSQKHVRQTSNQKPFKSDSRILINAPPGS